ncbi:MAG: DMT family transporter [Ferruginibacter sp.]
MAKTGNKYWQWLLAGILFAILWPSASTATKVGLTAAQPLVIALVRFALASSIMLFIAHGIKKQRLPKKDEWKQIALYGFLNITVYLGCYVIAMQNITAGIGALAVAINPVFISFLSVFFLKEKLTIPIIIALSICTIGVVCASWPLFGSATVTVSGLLILLFSMLSYSAGAIYFSSKSWNGLSLLTINGWQTLLGGIFLLPVMILFYKAIKITLQLNLLSASWLAILVSIIAVQLWMWLLSINPVRAGLWLFLCPLFGFIIAAWWMGDNIDIFFTVIGVLLVITGLLLSKN